MSTLTWITETELEQEIKTKEVNFVGKTTWKLYIGGEKMTNASSRQVEASKVKMSRMKKSE